MEKIEITREEFKKKTATIVGDILKENDDAQIALVQLFIGAKIINDIEKKLFDEEKEEKEEKEEMS